MESGKKDKILIVDDAPENIQVLMGTLKDQYDIVAAINGDRALKMAVAEPRPDLILLDIKRGSGLLLTVVAVSCFFQNNIFHSQLSDFPIFSNWAHVESGQAGGFLRGFPIRCRVLTMYLP